MSYSNGLLPSSSSTTSPQRGLPDVPGVGFKLTDDGNYDIDGKQLTNVSQPTDGSDGTTKAYVDSENAKQDIAIADKASKNDLNTKLNIDGSKSMTGDLNMNNNKKINLSNGSETGDSVNYSQLLEHTENQQNNYHLQPSFTFYKNFGDKSKLTYSSLVDPFPNHKHYGLYSVKKERFSSNFGGEALVSLKMTNKLPSGNYTVLFDSFSAIINSSFTHVNDEVLNSQVFGHTVLCKSNANVFCRNSRLFLAFRRKNFEFSMEANFQRKVTLIRDAYCFQLCEFSNDNSLVTKIDFEFSSEDSLCSINDFDH